MFVILVGILFNKFLPYLSFQIYSSRAHKREATDMNMSCGESGNKPRLFNKNDSQIVGIFLFLLLQRSVSEAPVIFD